MKLFSIKRTDKPAHDSALGFVVRADTESQARTLCANGAGDEGSEFWLIGKAKLDVTVIADLGDGSTEKPGVILRSFLHGMILLCCMVAMVGCGGGSGGSSPQPLDPPLPPPVTVVVHTYEADLTSAEGSFAAEADTVVYYRPLTDEVTFYTESIGQVTIGPSREYVRNGVTYYINFSQTQLIIFKGSGGGATWTLTKVVTNG